MQSLTSTQSRASERPGRPWRDGKPARERTTGEFSDAFKQASSDNGYLRSDRRAYRERLKAEKEADGRAQAERDKLEAAKQAWKDRVATQDQKDLVRKHERALDFVKRHLSLQPAHERIHQGFAWPGGWVIEGEVWRDPFVETGLRTWEEPFLQRVLASMGKASKDLCVGDTKDGCVRNFSKLHGSDKLYGFFAVKCRDMFRLDCDRTFASEAELLSWLAFRVMESGAPCMPHIVVWIPDDRYPGRIRNPHFYFLLPEGRAVWPEAPDSHHRLLRAVIEALNEAFECDPGGLAHPFHGKIPLSPFTDYVVPQDTCMPALDEYADHMKLTWLAPEIAFRQQSVDRMVAAGFDRSQSNTWFSVPSVMSTTVARDLHRNGFNVADEDAFEAAISDTITPEVMNLIKPAPGDVGTIEEMIARCARWAARTFDPDKGDATPVNRGAIAHLIEPTDTLREKRQKGQAYVAEKRTAATQAMLKPVYKERRKRDADHSRTAVAKATGRSYNNIKRHEFEVDVAAVAELLTELVCSLVAVKEVHPGLRPNTCLFDPASGRPWASLSGLPPPPDPDSGQTIDPCLLPVS
ncbi:hypothetical protein H8A95_09250 [Bradyrhizobium sp. Pear76]|uniref:hypothetical protein n=1 Tax=Bradyrhizobium oropedii TaxID=1571201 RepID=UPI001E33C818|nr:hypothetical protein [Bradyrhizobium oropedii]MCC8962490.1 hypothetical protein [Bradyrhizobium oropedii]